MGLIAKVTEWFYQTVGSTKTTQVQLDQGAGYTAQAPYSTPSGVASTPMPGDLAVCLEVPGSGQTFVVGYIDPQFAQGLATGEAKLYSRDSSGAEVASLYLTREGRATLKNSKGQAVLNPDGSGGLSNDNGGFTLQAGGSVIINGVTIDPSGNISGAGSINAKSLKTTGDVQAGIISVTGHKHGGVTTGGGTTLPPVP